MKTLFHLIYVLWTGEGMWWWVKPWLPWLFRIPVIFWVLRLIYRIYWAPPNPRVEYVRGSRLVQHRWVGLRRRLSAPGQLHIGGVAWPWGLESLHLLVSGATGAGKSQTIHGTLGTLRVRGDAAIITDIGSEALRGFGQPSDVILNPLDARSADWSPFADMESAADAERLAKSMIPDHEGIEREWFIYSQVLVAATLRRLWERGEATNGALLHALTLATPTELKALVQGLPAQALFHEGAEKMLASVRGIVGSYFAPYSYLSAAAGAKDWSIRRHVREGKGWLWLSYREDQAAALRPLLAAWIGEAVNAALSLQPDSARRKWLLLDEVASLGRVQGLSDALTKGRKYGLCAMMGLQSISQLRDVYGKDGAQTLLSCLSSQLLLRANDPETAEYASLSLGEAEVLRQSIAHGKERVITEQHHIERLVLASQLQGLPNRVGYLRLAGEDIVRCVTLPLVQRPTHMEAFVPRTLSAEAPPPVPALPAAPSVRRPALDADAILNASRHHPGLK
jgi:type IV secretory pathway TraG/TraD family ATPase VirD4